MVAKGNIYMPLSYSPSTYIAPRAILATLVRSGLTLFQKWFMWPLKKSRTWGGTHCAQNGKKLTQNSGYRKVDFVPKFFETRDFYVRTTIFQNKEKEKKKSKSVDDFSMIDGR